MAGPPHDTEVELLRRHRDVLTNLARLAALPGLSREEFFHDLVTRVAEAVEIDHVKLVAYRSDRSDLLLIAGVGWDEGIVGSASFATDLSSPPGRAFRTGEPVTIEDFGASHGFHFSETLRSHGIVSLINVPIFVDGATWGVLEGDSTTQRHYSCDSQAFMVAAAAIAGLVMERMNIEEARRQAVADVALEGQRHALLLTEMQHRVKNNFQTLMSMVQLRKAHLANANGAGVIDEICDGIIAMSLAHEQLGPGRTGELVELSRYLRGLVASISKPHDGVTIEVGADEINVGIDEAVPLGLIVNEAITNAVKHAFPDGTGRIDVRLFAERHGEAVLCISDDGVGRVGAGQGGSGIRLMTALARQLRGAIEREPGKDGGTMVRVRFPRRPHRAAALEPPKP
ncbi:MAG TPA: GAF domain-containing protein [Caulobacteraceae bacterium]|nr:GAF domain-containing protein [Caulobacteraceae bacterium]